MRRSFRSSSSGPASGFHAGPVLFLTLALVLAVLLAMLVSQRGCSPRESGPVAPVLPPPVPAVVTNVPPPPLHFSPPTAQTRLLETNSTDVYMPTASGRIESAAHGSVRTGKVGKSIMATFHEGIDIAPMQRDRHGRALDDVRAAAPGRVGYCNKAPGNSNYGRYVVLVHDEPIGPIYTLYAHLAEVDPKLRAGLNVEAGARLGRMGNTPEGIIPIARSHLHFEVGLINNPRFDRWFKSKKLTPDHGIYNGQNLIAVQPLAPFAVQAEGRVFDMREFLCDLPVTFELIVAPRQPILFFEQYPALWNGPPPPPGATVVLSVSESGVPVSGRRATAEEAARLTARAKAVVLRADEDALGRNGKRLVVKDGGTWRLGRSGEGWLEILTYR